MWVGMNKHVISAVNLKYGMLWDVAQHTPRGGWCAPVAVGCRVVPGEYERRRRLEVEIEARKDHRPRAADRYINRPKDPKSHVP